MLSILDNVGREVWGGVIYRGRGLGWMGDSFVCGVGSCDRNSRGVVKFGESAVEIKRCRDCGEAVKLGTVFDDRRKKNLSSTLAEERKIEEEERKGRRVSIYL